MELVKKRVRRVGVAVVGGVVLLVGIVTIPYPGPGWLIVFAGLAILATEFKWARRILHVAKDKYTYWQQWLQQQNMWTRAVVLIATGLVVILTLWLLNVFGMITTVLHLQLPWLSSPFLG